ncbi:MAG: CopG family ribbon-helix-helix protein [Methanomethylophilus sp.]|jgi:CopG family nickel-responsive transcriptional regulator
MAVVSVSLSDEDIAALERIRDEFGLNGRSEAVRASIASEIEKIDDMENLEGLTEGVLITIRRDHSDPWMSIIQAKHQDAIKTQLHSHLRNKKCLEVMVMSCDAAELKDMLREIERAGKADYVRFVSG